MNGNDCFFLTCSIQVEVHTVDVTTPNFQVITQSELNSFNGNIDLFSDLNYTLNEINNITQKLDEVRNKLLNISQELLKLNFNVSDPNPYGNFTELRYRLRYLLGIADNITSGDNIKKEGGLCPEGPWSSASCFFQSFAVGIITAVIFVGLVLGLYFLLEKTGTMNKLKGKRKKKAKDSKVKVN